MPAAAGAMTCSTRPIQLLQGPCRSRQLTQQLHRCVSQKEVSQMRMPLQRKVPACVTKLACVAHTQQQWLLVRCVLECVHHTCSFQPGPLFQWAPMCCCSLGCGHPSKATQLRHHQHAIRCVLMGLGMLSCFHTHVPDMLYPCYNIQPVA